MKKFILVGALSGALGIIPGITGALTFVDISGSAFVPQNITVPLGETVRWTNLDSMEHTSTSDTWIWDSGILFSGDTFDFTFNFDEGTFPYHCSRHSWMTGTVTGSYNVTVEPVSLGRIKSMYE